MTYFDDNLTYFVTLVITTQLILCGEFVLTPTMSISYTKDQLLSLRRPIVSGTRLPPAVLRNIRQAGISNTKPTSRGKRGGSRKQRKSKVSTDQHQVTSPVVTPLKHFNSQNQVKIKLKAALWNAQSARNKTLQISDTIVEDDLDILFLTETWLKQTGDESTILDMLPNGYKIYHIPRPSGKGGGVAMIVRKNIHVDSCTPSLELPSFEMIEIVITAGSNCLRAVCILQTASVKIKQTIHCQIP